MLHILDVPERFRPPFPFPYPPHQLGPLVEEFVHRELGRRRHAIALDGPWVYVPVYWTSYACRMSLAGRWTRRRMHSDLAAWLDRLRPGFHYVTVSQHDDGLAQRGAYRPAQPILEFSAGGRGDVPIPLLCDPHPLADRPRDVRASFVGSLATHPLRGAMSAALAGRSEYVFRDVPGAWRALSPDEAASRTASFVDLLHRSQFALCPRGYGRTSFRLYEAMQLGAVPVYIYDEPWLPWADSIDWREFCVLVPAERVDALHNLLSSLTDQDIERMRRRGRELLVDYFTLPGVLSKIVGTLQSMQRTVAELARAA
jgi:hypothetical protein